MVFERAMVVSYRFSIVAIALFLAAICCWMSPTLKSTGGGWLWVKIWGESCRPMWVKF